MQKLQSYQFAGLSQNELINVSGGHTAASGFEILCGGSLLSLPSSLGSANFELTPTDFVIELGETPSLCIAGFDVLGPVGVNLNWKL